MAGEFDLQSEGNWWNPSMNFLRPSQPYSSTINGAEAFNWLNHHHAFNVTTSPPSISDGGSTSSNGDMGFVIHQNNCENPKDLSEIENLSSINGCSDPLMMEIIDDWNQEFLVELDSCTDMECSGTFQTIQSASEHTEMQPLQFRSDDERIQHEALPNQLLHPRKGLQLNHNNTTLLWNSMSQYGILPYDLLNCGNPISYCGAKRQELASDVKECHGPAAKRPRIETPSPLPTFKVRKEKLGDRITALQQLVSPFGKTDTASVLHEAIEYIKNLHDQVNVLSGLYFDGESSPQLPHHLGVDHAQKKNKKKEDDGPIHDLKNRGLCVVPISSAFQVYGEGCNRDFLTPIFGGSFW